MSEEEENEKNQKDLKDIEKYKDYIIIGVLSLIAVSTFFIIDISLENILSFDLQAILSYKLLLLFLFPLPFAYASSISLKKFQKASLASAVSLIFLPLGLKFALLSLTVFLGVLVSSYMARNIFNDKNHAYTLYKSTSYAILIFGLLAASLFVYSYNERPEFRDKAQNALASRVEGIISSLTESVGNIPEELTSNMDNVSKGAVKATEGIVMKEMQESGRFSPKDYKVVQRGFDKAEENLTQALENKTEGINDKFNIEDKIDFKSILKTTLEPNPMISGLMFVFILFFSFIVKFPFGLVSALYGKTILKLR